MCGYRDIRIWKARVMVDTLGVLMICLWPMTAKTFWIRLKMDGEVPLEIDQLDVLRDGHVAMHCCRCDC